MTTLERTLNLRDLILLIVGSVIGSGIFLVPGAILRQVNGSVGLALAVWVCGGLLSLLGALTYGELSAMNPAAGGLYVYIREGFGRLPAFLYGWTLFLAIATGSIATLAAAFSGLHGPDCSTLAVWHQGSGGGNDRSGDGRECVGYAGKRGHAELDHADQGGRDSGDERDSAGAGPRLQRNAPLAVAGAARGIAASFGIAMIAVLWAYEGWQFASYSAGEARNPQRDFPRAFFAGTVFLMAIYLVAVIAYLAALGPEKVAASDTIAATAIDAVLGAGFAKLVALMILVSTFSAANSIQLTAPRVFYAMATDGLFFRRLAEVHSRFRTPAIAVLACGAWSSVLVCAGQFSAIVYLRDFYGLDFLWARRGKHLSIPAADARCGAAVQGSRLSVDTGAFRDRGGGAGAEYDFQRADRRGGRIGDCSAWIAGLFDLAETRKACGGVGPAAAHTGDCPVAIVGR